MPSIREGLSFDGAPEGGSADVFGAMVREQASKPAPEPRAAAPTADPAADSAAAITGAMLANGTASDRDVRSGMDFGRAELSAKPAQPREPLPPAEAELVEQAKRELAAEQAERLAGRQATEQLHIREFIDRLGQTADENDVVNELATFRGQVSEDVYTRYLYEVAAEMADYDSDTASDEESENFAALVESLDANAATIEAFREVSQKQKLAEELLPVVAKESVEKLADTVKEWQHERGYSSSEAKARLNAIENAVGDLFPTLAGHALHELEPESLGAVLRAADATLFDQLTVDGARTFQEGVAGAQTTSVRDGLEILTPFGTYVRPNAINLDAAFGAPIVSDARVVHRATHRPATADDIRAAVASGNPRDIRAGFTGADGKPASVDVLSGNAERRRRELEDARARDRGLLR